MRVYTFSLQKRVCTPPNPDLHWLLSLVLIGRFFFCIYSNVVATEKKWITVGPDKRP